MKKYEVSEEILNKLLNHLAERPYKEVFKMIHALQADAKEIVPMTKETEELPPPINGTQELI